MTLYYSVYDIIIFPILRYHFYYSHHEFNQQAVVVQGSVSS